MGGAPRLPFVRTKTCSWHRRHWGGTGVTAGGTHHDDGFSRDSFPRSRRRLSPAGPHRGLQPRGIAGGDRHHRAARGVAPAGRAVGPRVSAPHPMRQQGQAAGPRLARVRIRPWQPAAGDGDGPSPIRPRRRPGLARQPRQHVARLRPARAGAGHAPRQARVSQQLRLRQRDQRRPDRRPRNPGLSLPVVVASPDGDQSAQQWPAFDESQLLRHLRCSRHAKQRHDPRFRGDPVQRGDRLEWGHPRAKSAGGTSKTA